MASLAAQRGYDGPGWTSLGVLAGEVLFAIPIAVAAFFFYVARISNQGGCIAQQITISRAGFRWLPGIAYGIVIILTEAFAAAAILDPYIQPGLCASEIWGKEPDDIDAYSAERCVRRVVECMSLAEAATPVGEASPVLTELVDMVEHYQQTLPNLAEAERCLGVNLAADLFGLFGRLGVRISGRHGSATTFSASGHGARGVRRVPTNIGVTSVGHSEASAVIRMDHVRETAAQRRRQSPIPVARQPRRDAGRPSPQDAMSAVRAPPLPAAMAASEHVHTRGSATGAAPNRTAPQSTAPRSNTPQITASHSTAPHTTAPHTTAPHITGPRSIEVPCDAAVTDPLPPIEDSDDPRDDCFVCWEPRLPARGGAVAGSGRLACGHELCVACAERVRLCPFCEAPNRPQAPVDNIVDD